MTPHPQDAIMRRVDWPERLAEFLVAAESRPFVWGETDCCLFVCDAVLVMTDFDLAAEYRGKYSSQLGAARIFASLQPQRRTEDAEESESLGLLESFISGIAIANDIREVPVLCAQRGDVVLFDQGEPGDRGLTSLGVVGMHGTHVHSTAETGTAEIPIANCRRAWRIG